MQLKTLGDFMERRMPCLGGRKAVRRASSPIIRNGEAWLAVDGDPCLFADYYQLSCV